MIGQMFGTTIEEALDERYGKGDGEAFAALEQMGRETAVNMLPLFGVIPMSLLANKDFSDMGQLRPITSEYDLDLEKKYQGRDRASLPARVISDATRNILTPAQVDYIVRTTSTTLGADFVQGVTAVHEYNAYGFVPAKYEIPVIRQFYQNLESRPQAVDRFYKYLEDIEPVAKTAAYLSQPGNLIKDPTAYSKYQQDNAAKLAIVDTFTEARKDINEYRRALIDLDKMKSLVTQSSYKAMQNSYLRLIEERAKSANMIAEAILPK